METIVNKIESIEVFLAEFGMDRIQQMEKKLYDACERITKLEDAKEKSNMEPCVLDAEEVTFKIGQSIIDVLKTFIIETKMVRYQTANLFGFFLINRPRVG